MILLLLTTLAYAASQEPEQALREIEETKFVHKAHYVEGGPEELVFDSFLDTPMSNLMSDHTLQIMDFYSGNTKVATGLTWNICNQGRAPFPGKPYTNNPFNVEEVNSRYKARKAEQIEHLNELIQQHNVDFVFLQELDGPKETAEEFCDQIVDMKYELSAKFEQAILYNYHKWSLKRGTASNQNGFSKICAYGKGLSVELRKRQKGGSEQSLVLINVHGGFDKTWGATWENGQSERRKELDDRLVDEARDNKMVIVGGDWNQPVPGNSNRDGKYEYPTNFDLPPIDFWLPWGKDGKDIKVNYRRITEENLLNVGMTHVESEAKKQYDGFVVYDSAQKSWGQEILGSYFKQDKKDGTLRQVSKSESSATISDYARYEGQWNLPEPKKE